MLLAKLRYYLHCELSVYYFNKENTLYDNKNVKWQKYDDKFWKHIHIANYLREKYRF